MEPWGDEFELQHQKRIDSLCFYPCDDRFTADVTPRSCFRNITAVGVH
jgi:hypothetical protein